MTKVIDMTEYLGTRPPDPTADPEYIPDTYDTLDAAVEFAGMARYRALASPMDDPLDDDAAAMHYKLALQVVGSVALSLFPPGMDDETGFVCDKLRAALKRNDLPVANEARRELFAELLKHSIPV